MKKQDLNRNEYCVVYWDSSAVLSTLFKDEHSEDALIWFKKEGVHLISSLGYSEVCAVISRLRREKILANVFVEAAFDTVTKGPLRHLNVQPGWKKIMDLSAKWPLRGADLWHLAAATTLQQQIPELILLTYDSQLAAAAGGEGLLGTHYRG